MLKTGLVSVTFRALPPKEIIDLVAAAGLAGIEWGGDRHVPPGDAGLAAQVRAMTIDAGLQVSSYGSYFYAGQDSLETAAAVVRTAGILQAPTIRIWAGKLGSAKADAEYRQRVVGSARAMAKAAADEGIAVAFEFHQNTIADNTAAALALLDDIAHENINMYWQPQQGTTVDERLQGLQAFLPRLCNVHVMNSDNGRKLLAGASAEWLRYLALLPAAARLHWALIEFVKDDAPAALLEDAGTLQGWVAQIQSGAGQA